MWEAAVAERSSAENREMGEDTTSLQQVGYRLVADLGVWKRPGFEGIPYSDGDETEERLLSVVKGATDLSVVSPELQQACTDWPSLYHLGKGRANILRPFERRLVGADVLEVGAGCGAITRYLGEIGARVTALEGSIRRASIARARTRGLSNVEVVADSFLGAVFPQQYDVVTLLGVLEYSHVFVPGPSPERDMLQAARKLLRPGGMLIVAIENQLGLKYWAGAKEDHVGVEMFGLESRYAGKQARTYGMSNLAGMIRGAGFESVEVLAPFPDYKFPRSILCERAFLDPRFDAASIVRSAILQDVQLPGALTFALERVSDTVIKNGLGLQLANSFLVVASLGPAKCTDPGVFAYHFTTSRAARFTKQAVFCETATDAISVRSEPLYPAVHEEFNTGVADWSLAREVPYIQGVPLSAAVEDVTSRAAWTVEGVARALQPYIDLLWSSVIPGEEGKTAQAKMPAGWVDGIPQNVICSRGGEAVYIDQEWVWHEPVPVGFVLFRALLAVINAGCQIQPPSPASMSVGDFVREVFVALGLELSDAQIAEFAQMEKKFQEQVSGSSLADDWWSPDRPVSNVRSVWLELARLHGEVARRTEIAERAESHLRAAREDLAVAREFQRRLQNSFSWRMTQALRAVMHSVRILLGRLK